MSECAHLLTCASDCGTSFSTSRSMATISSPDARPPESASRDFFIFSRLSLASIAILAPSYRPAPMAAIPTAATPTPTAPSVPMAPPASVKWSLRPSTLTPILDAGPLISSTSLATNSRPISHHRVRARGSPRARGTRAGRARHAAASFDEHLSGDDQELCNQVRRGHGFDPILALNERPEICSEHHDVLTLGLREVR